jgi:Family of unknown function (DUF6328)
LAALTDRVQDALDEGRILVLGAQILLGFEYRSFFEPTFPSLPAWARAAKLLALCIMLVAFALMALPSSFHRLAEKGADTVRMHRVASQAIGAALLPLAVAMGLELLVAAQRVDAAGSGVALAVGAGAAVAALALWYVVPACARKRRHQEDDMRETPVEQKIRHVLTEARMVLPGALALLGFQLAVTLTEAFQKLPPRAQLLHLVDIVLTTLSVVLLIAPAAYHRIAEGGEATESFHRIASGFVLTAMIPLCLALSGDLALVAYQVVESAAFAALLGAGSLVFFFVAWFGVALGARGAWRRRHLPAHA